jgi:uncharacterized tellurite resistance protein B-like protein
MSLFNKCFDNLIASTAALPQFAAGENGSMEFTSEGVGDSRVALFFALMRNIPSDRISSLLAACLGQVRTAISEGKREIAAIILADIFVLAFQTRDCRGGKGERKAFYDLLFELYCIYPQTVMQLITLLPKYGYFKDFVTFASYLEGRLDDNRPISSVLNLQEHLMMELALELQENAAKVSNAVAEGKIASEVSISLCAKFCPREGRAFERDHKSLFVFFLKQLFPTATSTRAALIQYRRLLATLTPYLDIVELKMCGKRFADIDFDHVPSLAVKKYRKALLNEDPEKEFLESHIATGNRHPDDTDRIACRTKLVDRVLANNVKGKQLFPHEIVRELMKYNTLKQFRTRERGRGSRGRNGRRCGSRGRGECGLPSAIEVKLLCNQWASLRDHIVASLQDKRSAGAKPAVDLGHLVPLVDVSGSMNGEPMEVAIALGILVSEINQPMFRNRFLTFESQPQWVKLNDSMTLAEKVKVTQDAPWGGSTNFAAAMRLIAAVVEENGLPMGEVPDMIVFSDMQFDIACGGGLSTTSMTHLHLIQEMFHDLGMRICGEPYPAPRIIFWNLRGTTSGFPAQSNAENVQMLSGYSPSLFKFVVEGEAAPQEDNTPEEVAAASVTAPRPQPRKRVIADPYVTLRKVLDDERYNDVREILSASSEKELAPYSFVDGAVEEGMNA